MLTLEKAKELLAKTTTQEHLFLHAKNVMVAMGGLARHFGEDEQHWMAIGYLHDYDYEQYPEEHLQHTAEPLKEEGLTDEEIRGILAHGYGHCNDVQPLTNLEKSLYTVDELTGIVQAAARMRPAYPAAPSAFIFPSLLPRSRRAILRARTRSSRAHPRCLPSADAYVRRKRNASPSACAALRASRSALADWSDLLLIGTIPLVPTPCKSPSPTDTA